MSSKYSDTATERGQLDNGWHLKATAFLISYVLLLVIAAELGVKPPAWLPGWVVAVPPAVVVFWWVPVLAIFAISAGWSRLRSVASKHLYDG